MRIVTMLCMALTIVFAGAQLGRTVDRVQHLPDAEIEHQHIGFSEIVAEPPHHDQDVEPAESDSIGHAAGHHHHNGADVGAAVPALPVRLHVPAFADVSKPLTDPLELAGLKGSGADRPPRLASTIA